MTKKDKSRQGKLDFGGHTFAAEAGSPTPTKANGKSSKKKKAKGASQRDDQGRNDAFQHDTASSAARAAPPSPVRHRFVGVTVPATPPTPGRPSSTASPTKKSSPSKAKTGVSSAAKQMRIDDFRPVASGSGTSPDRDRTSPYRPPNGHSPSIQLRFDKEDFARLQRPTKAMLKADAKKQREEEEGPDQDREEKRRRGRLGSMDLDVEGEELESGEEDVPFAEPSSAEDEMPRTSRNIGNDKASGKGKGKARAPVVIESTTDSDATSDSVLSLPAPPTTSRVPSRGSKRAHGRATTESDDDDDDELLSPKKRRTAPRSSTTPRAAPPKSKVKQQARKSKGKQRARSPEEAESSDLPEAPPIRKPSRRERPASPEDDDEEEEQGSEDVDDLDLSDFEATKTRLREKQPDRAGQKFASLRKAREARAKREDRAKEVRATRIIPDTDSEDERMEDVVEITSTEEEEEEDDDGQAAGNGSEDEDESIASYIVDEPEDDETRRQREKLMPQEFRGGSRQSKVYHFLVCCQYFVHAIVMPHINWLEGPEHEDWKWSAQQIMTHFQMLANTLVSSQAWRSDFQKALKDRPELSTEGMEATPGCEACNNQTKISTSILTFSGAGYNPYTMKERSPEPDDDDTSTSGSDSSSSAREWRDESFRCGRFCADRAQTFHEFWHWSHEVFYSLQDAVEKKRDRSIPLPRPGKKPKQAIVDRLRVDADRLTEKTKALAQEMWDDFVRREKVAKHNYGGV